MPGMNLKCLNNPAQRVATGKSLPLKQLEAIVVYGTPEQRTKVVTKVLPQSYTLSLNKSTHHILISIILHCDNLVRTQMLYHLRRKLNDMARSPCGNIILQQLLEHLPNAQRKEIAEAFVLNVDEEELETVCKHSFGNHVAQKMLEYPSSSEVLMDHLIPKLKQLAAHPIGQRTVAKIIDSVAGGAAKVVEALFGKEEENEEEQLKNLEDIFSSVPESLVLSALLKHPMVPSETKDSIVASLIEHAEEFSSLTPPKSNDKTSSSSMSYAEPDFITGANSDKKTEEAAGDQYPRHNFAFAFAMEFGDDVQRKELYEALQGRLAQFVETKGQVNIALAMFKFGEVAVPNIRKTLVDTLFGTKASAEVDAPTPAKKKSGRPPKARKEEVSSVAAVNSEDVAAVAFHPVKSLLLRSMLELDAAAVGQPNMEALAKAAAILAISPVAGPVLQRLVEISNDEIRAYIFDAIKSDMARLVQDPCASYLVQSLLEHTTGELKHDVVEATTATVIVDPHVALATAQGSRVVQKLVAYASDETVCSIVDAILAGEEDEDEEDEEEEDEEDEEAAEKKQNEEAEIKKLSRNKQREINRKKHYKIRGKKLLSYAVHNHACFAIQALLRETKTRLLDSHRKRMMNSLKPYVFDLAVSPWAGRIVLDTMLTAGSTELKAAIKNVVFLRAESWLSDVPVKAKGQAGIDPTMRRTLQRGRENDRDHQGDSKKRRVEPAANNSGSDEKKKAPKKLFRSMKK